MLLLDQRDRDKLLLVALPGAILSGSVSILTRAEENI
jgi:hypothetical protein